MNRIARYALALSLMVGSAAIVTAQSVDVDTLSGRGGAVPERPLADRPALRQERPSAVARLLARREALALSDAQVLQLEEVQRSYQARIVPLREQLAAINPSRGRGSVELREEVRPVMEQMRQVEEQTWQQTQAVLTEEQREQLRTMRGPGVPGVRGRDGARPGGPGGFRGPRGPRSDHPQRSDAVSPVEPSGNDRVRPASTQIS